MNPRPSESTFSSHAAAFASLAAVLAWLATRMASSAEAPAMQVRSKSWLDRSQRRNQGKDLTIRKSFGGKACCSRLYRIQNLVPQL
jgi:hypothetical protein